eukprot:9178694-Karenia_brevis.AAC.1
MSLKRTLWSNAVDDEVVQDSSLLTRSLLVLFNCVLSKVQLDNVRSSSGRNVMETLGLNSDTWPHMLKQAMFVEHRELAVMLVPGLTVDTRTANMLICQLVVCDIPDKWFNRRVQPCGVAQSGFVAGLHRCFVHTLCTGVTAGLLRIQPFSGTLGIHNLIGLGPVAYDVVQGLASVAQAQLSDIKDHQRGKRTFNNKPYERELERAVELLRCLQRYKVTMLDGSCKSADLPLQLGFADLREWKTVQDPCRSAGKSKQLHDFVQKPCKCGLLTWKLRVAGQQSLTANIDSDEWVFILIHQLKEQVTRKWEGLGQQVLRLHGAVPEGRVHVSVGEYVGVEQYCVSLLQKTRGRQ